jgi:phospholipase/carboxylesterase
MADSAYDDSNPHQGQPVRVTGEPLARAQVALVLVHGRGATAEDVLTLADKLGQTGVVYLAPQAAGNTWYPQSFLAPIQSNEPYLSSGLLAITNILGRVAEAGIPIERTVLAGFSQGACLTLEYAARYARRYGGVVGLSGGLIGPDDTLRAYPGSLAGTPVFFGCSDTDPYIAAARVELSADVFRRLGGDVTVRLYPGRGHEVNEAELVFVRSLLAKLTATSRTS